MNMLEDKLVYHNVDKLDYKEFLVYPFTLNHTLSSPPELNTTKYRYVLSISSNILS